MSSTDIAPIEKAITDALTENLSPVHLEVINESYMHNVPKGSETHFKVLVVSSRFESLPLIKVEAPQFSFHFELLPVLLQRKLNMYQFSETSFGQRHCHKKIGGKFCARTLHRGQESCAMEH